MADQVFDQNLLRYLRQQNIFGDPNSQMPNDNVMASPMPSVDMPDDYDPAARMRELYQPDTTMTSKYETALGEMPTRNKPGFMRRLVAGIAGMGENIDARGVEQLLYKPYYREMEDWNAKIKPLEAGASIERQNNTGLRSVANQIVSQEQSDRRLERQIARDKTLERQGQVRLEQGDSRLAQGDERLKQAEARMKIAAGVARGGQFEVDDTGNAFIVFRDGSKTPVDASYLSAEEKSALRTIEAAAGARARADNARDRIVERVIEDPDQPGRFIRARINLDTGDAEPIQVAPRRDATRPDAGPPKTELEQSRGVAAKAMKFKNANSKLGKYVTIKNGVVDIKRPGMITGPTQAEHEQIYQEIYGTKPPANTNKATAGAPPPGRVRVTGPNGQSGTVSEEGARSLPPGWRRQ